VVVRIRNPNVVTGDSGHGVGAALVLINWVGGGGGTVGASVVDDGGESLFVGGCGGMAETPEKSGPAVLFLHLSWGLFV
jgi:hypothetical protein